MLSFNGILIIQMQNITFDNFFSNAISLLHLKTLMNE